MGYLGICYICYISSHSNKKIYIPYRFLKAYRYGPGEIQKAAAKKGRVRMPARADLIAKSIKYPLKIPKPDTRANRRLVSDMDKSRILFDDHLSRKDLPRAAAEKLINGEFPHL